MKKLLLTFSAALFILNCNGQITFQKIFGDIDHDEGKKILETPNGGYIIAGTYYSAAFYLIKTDSYGEVIWSKIYADSLCLVGNSMDRTTDGGYVLVGFKYSCGGGPSDVYLIKTDSSGNLQWSRTYGTVYYDRAYDIKQTNDGGYIMVGSGGASNNGTLLIKTDSLGNLTWAKESIDGPVYSVQQTPDNGYIISGEGFFLLKTDSLGNALWSSAYHTTNMFFAQARSVKQTGDGNYIIAGGLTIPPSFAAPDAVVIKTDASGNILWVKNFGGPNMDYASSIEITNDVRYIITGSAQFGTGTHTNAYLVKMDTTGNLLWSKIYGGIAENAGNSVLQTLDGGYAIAGYTSSFDPCHFFKDVYFIKTDSIGNSGCYDSTIIFTTGIPIISMVNPNTILANVAITVTTPATITMDAGIATSLCTTVGISEPEKVESVSLSPNPFTTTATINFGNAVHNAIFSLYNLLGEKVMEITGINGENFQFNRGNLHSGVYVFEVREKEKSIGRGKAVIY